MRQILSIVVPLVLPTVVYLLYMSAMRRRAQVPGGKANWEEVPWTWLAIAGAALMVATLIAIALFGGASPGSIYQPARLIDGEIQPGGFVE